MGALLGFLPFIVFALVERSLGNVPGLAGAAWFTRWYPARVRAEAAALGANCLSTRGQPAKEANA